MLDVWCSPGCTGYSPICWQYAKKISTLDILSDPRSVYVTDTMILFSKWLFSVQIPCLNYHCIVLPFQNTQTQGNLVKVLHLSCYSRPRFRVLQTCMRRRSEEGISFKSFKNGQTFWGLNFVYYCFPFSNVHNLVCWLMCTCSFVSSHVSRNVFSPSI